MFHGIVNEIIKMYRIRTEYLCVIKLLISIGCLDLHIKIMLIDIIGVSNWIENEKQADIIVTHTFIHVKTKPLSDKIDAIPTNLCTNALALERIELDSGRIVSAPWFHDLSTSIRWWAKEMNRKTTFLEEEKDVVTESSMNNGNTMPEIELCVEYILRRSSSCASNIQIAYERIYSLWTVFFLLFGTWNRSGLFTCHKQLVNKI